MVNRTSDKKPIHKEPAAARQGLPLTSALVEIKVVKPEQVIEFAESLVEFDRNLGQLNPGDEKPPVSVVSLSSLGGKQNLKMKLSEEPTNEAEVADISRARLGQVSGYKSRKKLNK